MTTHPLTLTKSLLRSEVRRARRGLRGRRIPTAAARFRPLEVEGARLRLLRLQDSQQWTEAMRENEAAMRPWWPVVDDWQRATDEIAFADHYLAWRRRSRAGRGVPLVVIGPRGLMGEITTWNLTPGGQTGEVGIWMRPGLGRRQFLPLWAGYFDNVFGNMDLVRVSSPVAVGNSGPRGLVRFLGAEHVATIPGERLVQGKPEAHDVFALTRDAWIARREELYAAYPWPEVTTALPTLTQRA